MVHALGINLNYNFLIVCNVYENIPQAFFCVGDLRVMLDQQLYKLGAFVKLLLPRFFSIVFL